ncbi:MAG: hypothetical protein RML12_03850 [Xanthomonadales bacterium]|nr:hypothetical protein [Xanthomonadales bacterium]
MAWMLWKEGRVELGRRDVSLASVVSGFDALEEVFRRCPSLSAPDWRPLVAELRGFLAQAQPHFEGSAEGEAVLWDALAEHVENSGIVVFPAQPWDTIARRLGYVPAELPWQGERIPLEKVRVSEQAPLVRALQAAGLPALALGEEALDLYLETRRDGGGVRLDGERGDPALSPRPRSGSGNGRSSPIS